MKMIRHHHPSQRVCPVVLLRQAKLLDNPPPQTPVGKNRLALMNNNGHQINSPNF
ncbi:hypothetical protein PS723_01880 [Pseudomonas fluorescens]|uniref:Uncharacterized protein n=1 Tax=Pseudomonas fluorescens TaxID=294 RepID=A0A5E7BFY4_PSEFL|nr:hypothetical protein PS723_01880 [Pseudomonas fluorescens]